MGELPWLTRMDVVMLTIAVFSLSVLGIAWVVAWWRSR